MRILSTLFLCSALAMPLAANADTAGSISVTGSATVNVVPDLATLSLGVTTGGDTAAAAMKANSASLTAVIARLKAAGIADRDMQTSNLSLSPNWVPDGSGTTSVIKGYVASNMLTVQIKALDTTGAVLDAAIADGANTLNGLSFGLQNDRPVQDEARKAAVADALARGKLLAEAAGTTLGPILTISEVEGVQAGPMPMFKTADAMAVPVAAGEVGVSASVTITWALGK